MNAKIILTSLAGLTGALTVSAALVTYEGFVYTAGQMNNTFNGGLGWGGPWDPQAPAGPNYAVNTDSPLSFGPLVTTTGYMNGGGAYTNNGRRLATGAGSVWDLAGAVSDPYAGGSGQGNIDQGTVWFSALVRVNDTITSWDNVSIWFHSNNIPWAPSTADGLVIRSYGGAPWEIREGNSGTPTTTGVSVTIGTVYLFVAKFELSLTAGANNAYVWIFDNPTGVTLAGPDLPTGTALASLLGRNTEDLRFKSIGFYLDNAVDRVSVDEIRFGTTFASVTPVPEPSTYAAIAGILTLGGLALRRRRA